MRNFGINITGGLIACGIGAASLAVSWPLLFITVPEGIGHAGKTFVRHPALTESEDFGLGVGSIALAVGDALGEGFDVAARPVVVAHDFASLGMNILAGRV